MSKFLNLAVLCAKGLFGKLPVTLATSNKQELFVRKFDSKSSSFETKTFFYEVIYRKKNEKRDKNATSPPT